MLRALLLLLALALAPEAALAQGRIVWRDGVDRNVSATTLQTLQNVANRLDFPVTISSGFRDAERNAATSGSASNSTHQSGLAFDLSTQGLNFQQRQQLVDAALKEGFGGIGFYGENGHLHVDTGATRTWGDVPSWGVKPMNESYGQIDRSQTAGDPNKQTLPDGTAAPGGHATTGATNQPNVPLGSQASSLFQNTFGSVSQSDMQGLGDKLQAIVASLKGQCWSCDIYKKIHQGSTKLAAEAFNYLTRTAEVVAVAALILMIVLAVKILKLIGTPFSPAASAEWARIYGYIGRIAVVFLIFFGAGAVDAMRAGSAGNSTDNPVRLIFVDAPTGIGTEVGCAAIRAAQNSGLGGSSVQGCNVSDGFGDDPALGGEGMVNAHLPQALGILKGLHELSVGAIAVGVWLAVEAPFKLGAANIVPAIGVVIAGLAMTVMFFWFSITFGFRYIDALIRTTIMAAFMPFFLYLWIFESSRGMAIRALKTLAYVGAVFAASGIVFIIADQVMCAGLSRALGGSCKDVSSVVSGGGFNQLVGNDGVGWVAIFILLGTAGLVIQISGAVFSLANLIIETNVSTDAGAQAASGVQSATQTAGAAPAKLFGR